jgi:hypothetical protein
LGALVQRNERNAVDAEQKRRLIDKVAQSELFQRSPRLREFLLYVAECTLQDRLGEVREQVIAERVFGRKPDPGGSDSIVRAEARNLRKRLETYFSTDGLDEPVILMMPKGGYSLAFAPRLQELPLEVAEEEESEAKTPAPRPAAIEPAELLLRPTSARVSSRSYWPVWIMLAAAAVIGMGLAYYWHARIEALTGRLGEAPSVLPFSAILNDDDSAEIVTSDTGFLQISNLLHRRITLDEYIARTYQGASEKTNPPDLVQNWNIYEFTDGREMAVAGLMLRRNAQFANRVLLHSGHAVQLQDFKDHNMVLIGSPISNPWAQLYEDKLNFHCDLATDGTIIFRNRFPRQQEQDTFPNQDDILHHRTYARIAFLPKTSDASSTLLIAGTTAQSTQAAGEFVTDQLALSRTLSSAGIDPRGQPHFFEILIRSNNFVGGAILREIVTVRVASAPEK